MNVAFSFLGDRMGLVTLGELLRQPLAKLVRHPEAISSRRPLIKLDLSEVAVTPDDPGSERCFVKPSYRIRIEPEYFVDTGSARVWQPDVYREAVRIAARQGSHRIIDVGCGRADKLIALHPRFDLVGIDFGDNIEVCRARFRFGTWLDHDLDEEGDLPLAAERWSGAVIVCADVIEHLRYPWQLLRKLRRVVDRADALLISTPERELTWGADHIGPPPNVHHVREWSLPEFGAFLRAEGFDRGWVGLTRSHNRSRRRATILGVIPGSGTSGK